MIKRISISCFFVFLLLAVLLKLSGVNSIFDIVGEDGSRETFYYGFIQNLSKNINANPIQIPKIPNIPIIDNPSGFTIITNFLSNIVNGLTTFLNIVSSILNFCINIFTFIYTLFQTIFSYWNINVIDFGV